MKCVLNRIKQSLAFFVISSLVWAAPADPEIGYLRIADGTRVIFNEKDGRMALPVINDSVREYLFRGYVVDVKTGKTAREFYVAPEVVKLSAHKRTACQIIPLVNDFEKNRESLFYVRGLFVPSSKRKTTEEAPQEASVGLTFALQMNLKMFYRPHSLKRANAVAELRQKLSVVRKAGSFDLINETPYYMTLADLKVDEKEVFLENSNTMIEPFGQRNYVSPHVLTDRPFKVTWRLIDDYGEVTTQESRKVE